MSSTYPPGTGSAPPPQGQQQQQQQQPPPPGYIPLPPPYLVYPKGSSPWLILLWVLIAVVLLAIFMPVLKVAFLAYGGACSWLFGILILVLAVWKLIDLMILLFRKLFSAPKPIYYPPPQ